MLRLVYSPQRCSQQQLMPSGFIHDDHSVRFGRFPRFFRKSVANTTVELPPSIKLKRRTFGGLLHTYVTLMFQEENDPRPFCGLMLAFHGFKQNIAEIEMLQGDCRHGNKGYATKLLQLCIEETKARKIHALYVHDGAVNLITKQKSTVYDRLGFKRVESKFEGWKSLKWCWRARCWGAQEEEEPFKDAFLANYKVLRL
jgi:hypothetical protein